MKWINGSKGTINLDNLEVYPLSSRKGKILLKLGKEHGAVIYLSEKNRKWLAFDKHSNRFIVL